MHQLAVVACCWSIRTLMLLSLSLRKGTVSHGGKRLWCSFNLHVRDCPRNVVIKLERERQLVCDLNWSRSFPACSSANKAILRFRFFNGDEKCIITVKKKTVLTDGVGRSEEVSYRSRLACPCPGKVVLFSTLNHHVSSRFYFLKTALDIVLVMSADIQCLSFVSWRRRLSQHWPGHVSSTHLRS